MKKAIVPLMLVATLGLGACSKPSIPTTLAAGETSAPAPSNASSNPKPDPTPPPPPAPPVSTWYVKSLFGPVLSDDPANKDKKVVVLTFDDGPNPETTSRVLDTLKENQIKAIFFVTGNAERYPEMIRRIEAEGHIIGTHTLQHENLRFMTKEKQRQVITTVNGMVKQVTGKEPRYFRPPFGAYNDNTLAIMQELNMKLLNWDHGSADWMDVTNGQKDPNIVIRDALAETPADPNKNTALHPGSVILFHDTLKHTADALPDVIKGLKAKGYEFVVPTADPSQAPS